MKNLILIFALLFSTTIVVAQNKSQIRLDTLTQEIDTLINVHVEDSATAWSLGGNVMYPKFIGIDGPKYGGDWNLGLSGTAIRNLDSHFGLRLGLGAVALQHKVTENFEAHSSLFFLNAELMAFFTKASKPVRPYFFVGPGVNIYSNEIGGWDRLFRFNEYQAGYQLSTGLGVSIKVSENVSIMTELANVQHSNSRLDGIATAGTKKGLLNANGDSWGYASLGVRFGIGGVAKWKESSIYVRINKKEDEHEINMHGDDVDETSSKKPRYEVERSVEKDTEFITRKVGPNVIELQNFVILFDYDSYEIRPQAWPILQALAENLEKIEYDKIVIRGWTDSIGGDDYNRKLSVKRAEAVKKYLKETYDIDKVEVYGMGINDWFENSDPINMQWNRCVKFQIKVD